MAILICLICGPEDPGKRLRLGLKPARLARKTIAADKAIVPSLARVMKVYASHATKKES
jgi:hypothetical protein